MLPQHAQLCHVALEGERSRINTLIRPLITINAWNEWVEGSYLLPDMLYGFEYLEAVKDVFVDKKYDRYQRIK